ncbi:MAG: glycosyltransferase family 9 protein, partial [Thermodesulfobacteriota bacterium]
MEADLTRLPLKSILIRSTNWIGDAIMTTPAVHTIRSNFPDARITMLAMPWVGDIFRLSPDVDEVIDYDKKVRHKGKVKGVLAVGKELREHQFDAVIYLQNAFEAAFIGSLAKIPVRAGFRRDGRGILLSHGVKIPAELRKKHQVYYYQYLCKALGMSLGPDRLHLPLPEKLKQWTETRLATLIEKHGRSTPDGNKVPVNPAEAERVPVIGFNPGAAYGPAKRWPAAKFSELATMICERLGDSGCVILVFGTDADGKAAAEIADSSARCGHHVVDLTGKTSLEQVIGL